MPNMMTDEIAVNWERVKLRLFRKERIPADKRTPLAESADRCIRTAMALTAPRSVSAKIKVLDAGPQAVELEGGFMLHGIKLSSFLKDVRKVHIFLVTIGPVLENEATALMHSGHQLEGYLLDSAGSLAVESFAENFENSLRKMHLAGNESVSMRLSPGYCDWPIEEQFTLAKIIDFSAAGVSLNQSCMMIPRKSISAMVGVGQKESFANVKSPCELCGKDGCEWRRIP